MIDNQKIIEETIQFVKEKLKDAESGHDWFHIERVWKNSLLISEGEILKNPQINLTIIQLGALLHDIADHKFHGGDDSVGPKVAREFLESLQVEENIISAVCNIIQKISFKGSTAKNEMDSCEGLIVQDSDRLDAIGAIGIARTFSYGGYRNRQMYDPQEKPNMNMDWETYKNNKGPTINHFYEKLLLIKDRMNTETGKKIAQKRHDYMCGFLEEFFNEWEGKA
jgi:uncharacterized protein